jgi:Metal-dependent hydrolases of the beta-lactamase superfamily III
MEITFLGTNGWFDTNTGNTTCVLAETKNEYIIFDAGGGLYRAGEFVKGDKPVYLLLTHLHLDHILGLQCLVLFNWPGGLNILVADNMKADLEDFMRPPFMSKPENLKTKTQIIALSQAANLPFKLEWKELEHLVPTVGYRLESEGKTIVFGLDSGVCDNLKELAKDADLFITECSFLPGKAPLNIHLNPQQAAQIALEARVKTEALIHFKADDYTDLAQRDEALLKAREIFARAIAPYDGEKLII